MTGTSKTKRFHRKGARLLALLVALCAACAGGGVFAIMALKPPISDVPIKPIIVTVPISYGVMTETLITRGMVEFTSATEVVVKGESSVVTSLNLSTGETIHEGQKLLDLSERPIFAFQGAVPMYRNLSVGDQGVDVQQLSNALVRLGYLNSTSNIFTMKMAEAISTLYRENGYSPPLPPTGKMEEIKLARVAVDQAKTELDNILPVNKSELLTAKLAVDQATREVADNPESQEASSRLTIAKQQLLELKSSPSRIAAKKHLSQAKNELKKLLADAGMQLQLNEVVFVRDLPAQVISAVPIIGDTVDGALFTLGAGGIQTIVQLNAAQHSLVHVNQSVIVRSDDGITSADGIITEVGDHLEHLADGGESFFAKAELSNGNMALIGQNAAVEITVNESGDDVLHVPEAAITSDANGRTFVDVKMNGDLTRRVEVMLGLILAGKVQITPLREELDADDMVIVDIVGG